MIIGSVPLKIDGRYGRDLYVVVEEWGAGSVSIDGDTISIEHGPRFYLASECKENIDSDMFWNPPLSTHILSATIDVSKLGCACNGAFYLVNMPASDATSCDDYCKSLYLGTKEKILEHRSFISYALIKIFNFIDVQYSFYNKQTAMLTSCAAPDALSLISWKPTARQHV